MQKYIIQQTLSNYFPKRYNILTSSGTSALTIILHTLKKIYKNKDEIILPSVVCPSLLSVIINLLKPVFVDMELKYFNMNFGHLKNWLTKNFVGHMCVHCYGIAANIENTRVIKRKKNFFNRRYMFKFWW